MSMETFFRAAILTSVAVSFEHGISPYFVLMGVWGAPFTSSLPHRIILRFSRFSHALHRAKSRFLLSRLKWATAIITLNEIIFPVRIYSSLSSFRKMLRKINLKTFSGTKLPLPTGKTIKFFFANTAIKNHLFSWLNVIVIKFICTIKRAEFSFAIRRNYIKVVAALFAFYGYSFYKFLSICFRKIFCGDLCVGLPGTSGAAIFPEIARRINGKSFMTMFTCFYNHILELSFRIDYTRKEAT